MIIAKTENYLKPFNQYWAEFANHIAIETEQCIFLQQLLVAAYIEVARGIECVARNIHRKVRNECKKAVRGAGIGP